MVGGSNCVPGFSCLQQELLPAWCRGRKKDQQVHKEECTEGDILKCHVLEGQFLKLRTHTHTSIAMKCVKQKSTTFRPQSQGSPRTLPHRKACEIPAYIKEQIHVTIFSRTDPQGSAIHVTRLFQPGGQLEKQLQNIEAPLLYSWPCPPHSLSCIHHSRRPSDCTLGH